MPLTVYRRRITEVGEPMHVRLGSHTVKQAMTSRSRSPQFFSCGKRGSALTHNGAATLEEVGPYSSCYYVMWDAAHEHLHEHETRYGICAQNRG